MISIRNSLKHALKIRCPRCGRGKLFVSYGNLVERCSHCRLRIKEREPDTWFFMYMSTAAITGIFVLSMLSLPAPKNQDLGAALIGLGALGIFFLTTPIRKSLAIAIESYTDSHSENPRYPDE